MKRGRYAWAFALTVLTLAAGGLLVLSGLDSSATVPAVDSTAVAWPRDSLPTVGPFVPIAPDPAEYARYEAEDAAWRRRNARQFTVAELRARGDGTRTAQDLLRDRIYEHRRRGDDAAAIAELERWLMRNPGDRDALLSLARLLNEVGRNSEAIVRYRQLLAATEGGGGE